MFILGPFRTLLKASSSLMRVDDMKSFTWKGQNMPRLGPLLQELVLVLGYDSKGIALAQEAMFV